MSLFQAFASSITGALATEAVMKGVGVGNEAATPLAAALTWLLKSGSGHIGQIVFAWSKGCVLIIQLDLTSHFTLQHVL